MNPYTQRGHEPITDQIMHVGVCICSPLLPFSKSCEPSHSLGLLGVCLERALERSSLFQLQVPYVHLVVALKNTYTQTHRFLPSFSSSLPSSQPSNLPPFLPTFQPPSLPLSLLLPSLPPPSFSLFPSCTHS